MRSINGEQDRGESPPDDDVVVDTDGDMPGDALGDVDAGGERVTAAADADGEPVGIEVGEIDDEADGETLTSGVRIALDETDGEREGAPAALQAQALRGEGLVQVTPVVEAAVTLTLSVPPATVSAAAEYVGKPAVVSAPTPPWVPLEAR